MRKIIDHESLNILKVFSKKELKDFDFYFERLYPDKNNTRLVFEYFKSCFPKFKETQLIRAEVLKVVFPAKKSPQPLFTKALIDLEYLLREFLIWKEVKENDVERERIGMEVFKKRNLRPSYLKSYEIINSQLDQMDDLWKFYYQFFINYDRYYSSGAKEIFRLKDVLQSSIAGLDSFYAAGKYKISCEAKNRGNVLKEVFELNFLKEFDEIEKESSKSKYILFYKLLFHLFKDNSFENCVKLASFFLNNLVHFPEEEQKNGFAYLINKIINNSRIPERKRFDMTFKLFEKGEKFDLILDKQIISYDRFTNIVFIAGESGNVEWGEFFFNKYKDYVVKSKEDNPYLLSQSYIMFYKNMFNDIVKALGSYNFIDERDNVFSRILMIKCFGELSAKEYKITITSHCRALENYIRRNEDKIGNFTYEACLNFSLFYKRIINQKSSKEKLINELKEKQVVAQTWLGNQANKLLK